MGVLICSFTYLQTCVLQFTPEGIVLGNAEQVLLHAQHYQHTQIETYVDALVPILYFANGIAS